MDLASSRHELQLAAVYAADRGLLKNMMSNQETPGNMVVQVLTPPSENTLPKLHKKPEAQSTNTSTKTPDEVPNDSNDIADRVIRDVKELYETRHNF